MSGTADNVKGNIKETAGAVTGDRELEQEGKNDQLAGKLKDAVSDVKDVAEGAIDKVRGK
ncbi:CsbD family protein [Paraconexibacter antarcticus]|uniref:CsbD family protein n=1 Tax=Paraconexibacter antarcticus TaxID=2949664 RepID=A0ABY5DTY2_9ACTN|nr:CsbD family protein [Paraconexibacter antarcticus]UTI64152.1 CsbD family protein [Paraconexibacter antarcticus]